VKPVSSVNRELSVESTDTFQLALDVERFGLYTLDIELKLAGHGTRTEHVNFAKLPPYRELTDAQKRASPYGINVHMGQDREMVVPFRDAGIVWFRDYGWSYDWLLRAKGADKKYAGWPYYPRIAAQFAIAGVMLMPCMMKAIGAPKEGAAPGQTVEITGWSRANAPEGKLEQYQVAIQTWDADRKKIDWHEIMMRIKWCEPMTHDWTEFRGSATISERTRTMTLIVYLRGKGTVWVDELRVVGSAATTSTSSPARAAAAAVKRRGEGTYFLHPSDTVLVVGDAISAEGGVYRLVFEDDIGTKYPGLAGAKAPKLVNAAAPGATAASVSRILPGHLDRHRPNVAVVCCGVNDSFMDVYGFATSMRAIVRTLKERSVAVTLLAPPPMNASNHPELTARSAALDQMIDQLRRLAAEEGVPLADCHATMKEHLAGGGATLDWGDGVHPNACGKRMMADALQSAWGFGEPLVE
jgi:lysophospholipase L1-like esterase